MATNIVDMGGVTVADIKFERMVIEVDEPAEVHEFMDDARKHGWLFSTCELDKITEKLVFTTVRIV